MINIFQILLIASFIFAMIISFKVVSMEKKRRKAAWEIERVLRNPELLKQKLENPGVEFPGDKEGPIKYMEYMDEGAQELKFNFEDGKTPASAEEDLTEAIEDTGKKAKIKRFFLWFFTKSKKAKPVKIPIGSVEIIKTKIIPKPIKETKESKKEKEEKILEDAKKLFGKNYIEKMLKKAKENDKQKKPQPTKIKKI